MKKRPPRIVIVLVFFLLLAAFLEGSIRIVRKVTGINMVGVHAFACLRSYFADYRQGEPLAPGADFFDATIGWHNAEPTGFNKKVDLQINEQGWRSSYNYQLKKTKPRVAIVGDSFTYGSNINYADTIAPQLQRLLHDKYEVMNFAVEGFSVLQMAITSTEIIKKYDPDFLIVAFIGHDFERSCHRCEAGTASPSIDKVGDNIVYRGIPITSPTDNLKNHQNPKEMLLDKTVGVLRSSAILSSLVELPYRVWSYDCLFRANSLAIEKIEREFSHIPVLFSHLKHPIPDRIDSYLKSHVRHLVSMEKEEIPISKEKGLPLDTSDLYHPGPSQTKIHALVYQSFIEKNRKPE